MKNAAMFYCRKPSTHEELSELGAVVRNVLDSKIAEGVKRRHSAVVRREVKDDGTGVTGHSGPRPWTRTSGSCDPRRPSRSAIYYRFGRPPDILQRRRDQALRPHPQLGVDQWCVTWKIFLADGTPLPHDQCAMAVVLKGGEIAEGIEYLAERPDGSRFWFTPYPAVVRNAEGESRAGSICWWISRTGSSLKGQPVASPACSVQLSILRTMRSSARI